MDGIIAFGRNSETVVNFINKLMEIRSNPTADKMNIFEKISLATEFTLACTEIQSSIVSSMQMICFVQKTLQILNGQNDLAATIISRLKSIETNINNMGITARRLEASLLEQIEKVKKDAQTEINKGDTSVI